MCTTADGAGPGAGVLGAGFGSVLEALRAGRAMTDYLNTCAARDLDGAACGEALIEIGAIQSALAAAQNGLLRRFDADGGHDADGYGSAAAWLAGKTGLGRKDAKAAVRQMRLLGRHPLLEEANGKSAILDAGYSDQIPAAIRHAVIARDKHCAWPGGCDRPAAASDVHHITHKNDGGPTSVNDCMLACQYHHDICIHRWGWSSACSTR